MGSAVSTSLFLSDTSEGLSFHKIWFKSVNNFWVILHAERQTQTDRQTDRGYHIISATSL